MGTEGEEAEEGGGGGEDDGDVPAALPDLQHPPHEEPVAWDAGRLGAEGKGRGGEPRREAPKRRCPPAQPAPSGSRPSIQEGRSRDWRQGRVEGRRGLGGGGGWNEESVDKEVSVLGKLEEEESEGELDEQVLVQAQDLAELKGQGGDGSGRNVAEMGRTLEWLMPPQPELSPTPRSFRVLRRLWRSELEFFLQPTPIHIHIRVLVKVNFKMARPLTRCCSHCERVNRRRSWFLRIRKGGSLLFPSFPEPTALQIELT